MRVTLVRRSLLLVLVLVGGLSAVPAAQAATKPFTLRIDPVSVTGGANVTFTATFGVPLGAQQQLGSADLTVPATFTNIKATIASVSPLGPLPPGAAATVVGNKIHLRNLAVQPNTSLSVTVTADVPCVVGTAKWEVIAKQANDFNGQPGNDLALDVTNSSLTTTVTGACGKALRFVAAPGASSAATTATTGPVILSSLGAQVSVEVIDGAGNRVNTNAPITLSVAPDPGPGTFGGGGPIAAAAGLATFPALRIVKLGSYRLTASSPGLASVTSDAFTVDQVGIPCPTTGCTATLKSGQSEVTIAALAGGEAGNVLRLSYGLDGGTPIDCPNYTELTNDEVTFDVTGIRAKLATYRIDKAAVAKVPNNGAALLDLCFGSRKEFTTKDGTRSPIQGTFDWDRDGVAEPVFVGRLPDCSAVPPDSNPCISKRQKNQAGDGIIQAQLPAKFSGDPKMAG